MKLPGILSLPVAFCLLLACSVHWILNQHQYPVLDGDSKCFLPIALSYSEGHGLVNPIWHPINVYDAEHPEELTWHGFLYPMVLGSLATSPSYKAIRGIIGGIWISCLVVCGFAFFRCAMMCGATGWRCHFLAIAALLAMAGLMPDGGRSELLVTLLLAVGLAFALLVPCRWHWLIFGILLGLLVVTSPIPAILAMLGLGAYACVKLGLIRAIFFLMQSILIMFVVFGLCFIMYPYSLKAWLVGMSLQAKAVHIGSSVGPNLLDKAHENHALIFFVLLAILACAAGVFSFIKNRQEIGTPVGLIFFAALMFIGIYCFSFRNLDRIYNAITFSPVIILALVAYASRASAKCEEKGAKMWNHMNYLSCCAVLMLASLVFFRLALVFPFFLNDGASYNAARKEFRALTDSGVKVGVTSGFFSLSENFSEIHFIGESTNISLCLVQQVNSGLLAPPQMAGYTLIKNTFSSVRPSFLGFKIANTCGGYNFAVYRRNFAATNE